VFVRSLELVDFRSYATAALTLEPGTTVILGPNGQGKTNLVEALGYLATLGSHRVGTDGPLVRSGADRAVVRARVDHAGRERLLELEITPGRANRAQLNGNPVRRPGDILGILRTVLFAPEDLELVKGDPAGRRTFLDAFLVACAPRWAAVRSDYDRIVRQRTALLRSAGGRNRELPTLDSWDDHLVRIGAQLIAGRVWAVRLLGPRLRAAYAALAGETGSAAAGAVLRCAALAAAGFDTAELGDGPVEADAVHGGTDPEVLAAAADGLRAELVRRRGDELDRGQCLVGPHRDDLVLTVSGLPARGYASHGESWSVALALRLASFEVLRARIEDGGDPVLLLDDVFAELDDRRRARLASLVADAEQVLVTAAVPDDVPDRLREAGSSSTRAVARYAVRTGEVVRAA
jgi:DNA replication and repair protein RecF